MADKKKDERSPKQILSDEMDRQLEENPPAMPTLEEFRAMAYERLEGKAKPTEKKPRRLKHIMTIAAIVVVAIGMTLWAAKAFDITPDVGADKNPKEEIITEDGVIIEDGGYGSSEEEDGVWLTEDWEQVKDAKTITSKVLIPYFIPKKYDFEKLTIRTTETGEVTCEYLFKNKNDVIEIEEYIYENYLNSFEIAQYNRVLQSKKGDVYIQESDNKIAIIQMHDGIILSVWSNLPDQDVIRIIENLE